VGQDTTCYDVILQNLLAMIGLRKRLSSISRHALLVLHAFAGGFGWTCDLASFFDQFRVDPAVRKYFGVRRGSSVTRLRVMPMGFRSSVQIAQASALGEVYGIFSPGKLGKCGSLRRKAGNSGVSDAQKSSLVLWNFA
jgi:hypothetical protein